MKLTKRKMLDVARELADHKVPIEEVQECIEAVLVEYNRGMKSIKIPRYILHRLYIKYGLRQSTIAKLLGCSQDTISRFLRFHNIPRRKTSMEMSKRIIIQLYLGEKKSAAEIANIYGCSKMTILRRLHMWGILESPMKSPASTRVSCVPEEVGPLIELDYINGLSYAKLSAKYGITRYRLKKYLVETGLDLRQAKGRIALDEWELAALYNKGATVQDLARRFGVGCTTIAERLWEKGIALRGNKEQVDANAVVTRYNSHMPMLRIAEETGYSYEAVRRCVREQKALQEAKDRAERDETVDFTGDEEKSEKL